DDLVLGEQVIAELCGIDPIDLHQADTARGPVVVQRGPDGDPVAGLKERLGPSVPEIPQPRGLPVVADALMETERGGNRVVVRGRAVSRRAPGGFGRAGS